MFSVKKFVYSEYTATLQINPLTAYPTEPFYSSS